MSFRSITNQKAVGINIKGKIYLFNKNVKVGENVTIYPGVSFQGEGEIVIGNNTFILNNTIIYSEKGSKILIGDDVMIAGQCYIINTNHNYYSSILPINKLGVNSADIIIENNVWISGNVQILKGVIIKTGSVIGAKALVNKSTEQNGVYMGIPAKLIKYRGDFNK
jgi:acetyltransferase-like isoleucine patch superfamily enzyme